jgi:hypothetical protein
MSEQPAAVLSAVEAARRIYNTPAPTPEQVGRTVEKIELGHLTRSPKGGTTTTALAIAEYLARRAAHNAARGRGGSRSWPADLETPVSVSSPATFAGFYRELLKDYFLAVVMRRRITHRSLAFQRFAVGSQVALLVMAVALLAGISTAAVRSRLVPPDHRTVKAWVAAKHADAKIHAIHKLEAPAGSYRVNFQYGSGGKQVQSSLILTLDGPQVVDVNSEL